MGALKVRRHQRRRLPFLEINIPLAKMLLEVRFCNGICRRGFPKRIPVACEDLLSRRHIPRGDGQHQDPRQHSSITGDVQVGDEIAVWGLPGVATVVDPRTRVALGISVDADAHIFGLNLIVPQSPGFRSVFVLLLLIVV